MAAAALAEELDRLARTSALDAYLAELDAELGPVTAQELTDARAWADVDLPADGVPVASVAEADRRAEPA